MTNGMCRSKRKKLKQDDPDDAAVNENIAAGPAGRSNQLVNTAPPNSAVSAEQLATIMGGRFTALEAQFQAQFQTLQRDVQRDVRSRDSKIKALEDQVKSLRRTQNTTISVASKWEDAWYLRWDGVKDEFSEVNLKLDGVLKILGIPDEDEHYEE